MKKYQFIKPLVSDRLESITLNFILISETNNIDKFLKSYVISNFWKGKFFIKKLIKRLFKHKVNGQFTWDANFWNIVYIENLQYTYKLPKEIENIEELENILSMKTKQNRMKDILKYQQLLKDGVNLNCPLFISGKALNHLGAKVNDSEIYFLDGSRRLLANILNDNMNDNALLINIK